jgi:hypothetical protein
MGHFIPAAELLLLTTLAITLSAPAMVEAANTVTSPTARADARQPESGNWLLARREGGCASLSILVRKDRSYKKIKSPAELAEKLRVNGHKADIKEFDAGALSVVEVSAPSAGMHAMFVTKEFCDQEALTLEKK